jgi:hypothetical protein
MVEGRNALSNSTIADHDDDDDDDDCDGDGDGVNM